MQSLRQFAFSFDPDGKHIILEFTLQSGENLGAALDIPAFNQFWGTFWGFVRKLPQWHLKAAYHLFRIQTPCRLQLPKWHRCQWSANNEAEPNSIAISPPPTQPPTSR